MLASDPMEAFLFLSKRCGIYYLSYTDQNKELKKISTRTQRKCDALRFLQTFRASRFPGTKDIPTLSEFYAKLDGYITANHQ